MVIGRRVQGILFILLGILISLGLTALGAAHPDHQKALQDLAPVFTVPVMVIGVLRMMGTL